MRGYGQTIKLDRKESGVKGVGSAPKSDRYSTLATTEYREQSTRSHAKGERYEKKSDGSSSQI